MALTMQKKNLIGYALTNGMTVCGVTAETGSGTRLSRAGIDEINREIENGKIHSLLVKDITRLGRDMFQVMNYIEWLKEKGVELICMDGSHRESDFMKQIGDVMGTMFATSTLQKKTNKR